MSCLRNWVAVLGWAGIMLGTSAPAQSTASALTQPGSFLRVPYLQFASPHLMHVVWRTAGPINPVVRFGTSPEELGSMVSTGSIICRVSLGGDTANLPDRWKALRTPEHLYLPRLHSAPVGTFQYEACLTNLVPATRYYYAVYDGDRRLTPADPTYSFLTPPPAGSRRSVRFAVLGDSGTGRSRQYDVYRAMTDYVSKSGRPLDFWIHVGDMAYVGGRDMEFQSRVFEPYEALMRHTVCWPTMGNHEGAHSKGTTGIGPYFDAYVVPTRGEAGGVASGTEAYYSFDHGNIHFICLDSHDLDRTPSGAMAKWLKVDLERSKADWIIAFWHHPPYTKGSHDSDKEKDLVEMRQHLMPIIESGGVDLVLTGHSHIYERSMLMDGAYATPTVAENVILDDGDGDPEGDGAYLKSEGVRPHAGTVQVVAGHGGTTLGRSGSMPVMRTVRVEHGSVLVDVEGDTLTAKMVNYRGAVRDTFSIVKRGTVDVNRIALPWQLPEYKKPESEAKTAAAPAVDHRVLVDRNADWRYRVVDPPRGRRWTLPGFDVEGWSRGRAGFGFGDTECATRIEPPAGHPPAVYLRTEFEIIQADAVTELGLWVDYTDGLIAYVNGREVARTNVGRSSGRNVQGVKSRSDRGAVYLTLKNAHQHLRDGRNVLAIEAHAPEGTRDFAIDPVLVLED